MATEAMRYLIGAGKTMVARYGGDNTHWWLEYEGHIFDPTAKQFDQPFDYSMGRACGMQAFPSKRTMEFITNEMEKDN